MNRTTYYHEHFENPLFVKSNELVTSVRIDFGPGHDEVSIWNRGGKSGSILVTKGDGVRIAARLIKNPIIINEET